MQKEIPLATLRQYLAVLVLLGALMAASAAASVDVRIVVDVSQTAQDTDTQGLRGQLISQLVAQLPESNRAGLWGYTQVVHRYLPHGQVNPLWRQVASIHAENLSSRGRGADLQSALNHVLADLDAVDRPATHVVLISNGAVSGAAGAAPQSAQAIRHELLAGLANQLAAARVHVHTVALAQASAEDDLEFISQFAQITDGLHRLLSQASDVSAFVRDLLRVMQVTSEAVVDEHGRFYIGPGTQTLTVTWPRQEAPLPQLKMPDGTILNRLTPVLAGRWLYAQQYEIATLQKPATGWWTVEGMDPQRVALVSDLQIQVKGLAHTVIPTHESSAALQLYSQGQPVTRQDFLDLLDVRAWLVQNGTRQALPVDPENGAFRAYFVNLKDGAYELEAQVVGPTFREKVVQPFSVSNPLKLQIRAAPDGDHTAWVSFAHAQIDHRTLKVAAKVRKPPQLGVLLPALKLPAGLWQIGVDQAEGIVEMTLSLSGNYLSGEGFFLKTKPVAFSLPLPAEGLDTYYFDAEGKPLTATDPGMAEMQVQPDLASQVGPASEQANSSESGDAAGAGGAELPAEVAAPVASLPAWFVAVASLVNLLGVVLLGWWLRPAPLPAAPA